MRDFTVSERESGKRIGRAVSDNYPALKRNSLFKALRKRDIKVNGARVNEEYAVRTGDTVEVYISDEKLFGGGAGDGCGSFPALSFDIVYEDAGAVIVNKRQGMPVHKDRDGGSENLIDAVGRYLAGKGAVPGSSGPYLCHRLDRNTGGLVLIAKDRVSLAILQRKMKEKEILKYYQCLVFGKMDPPEDELRAYLSKDTGRSRVFIRDRGGPDAAGIITRYRTLSYDAQKDLSRLEVELVTGRTHQIRAHFAHIGHPVAGDGKYGTNAQNKPLGLHYQALWAYKLVFAFRTDAGSLNHLKGRQFEVEPGF